MELSREMKEKRDRLLATLGGLPDVALRSVVGSIAPWWPGAAFEALGSSAVAVTADSPSVARSELADAKRLAELIGIPSHCGQDR